MVNKFSSRVAAQDNYVYKVVGEDKKSGKKAWWVLRIEPSRLAIFRGVAEKGNINFVDYGEILASGFGEELPAEIAEEYNF